MSRDRRRNRAHPGLPRLRLEGDGLLSRTVGLHGPVGQVVQCGKDQGHRGHCAYGAWPRPPAVRRSIFDRKALCRHLRVVLQLLYGFSDISAPDILTPGHFDTPLFDTQTLWLQDILAPRHLTTRHFATQTLCHPNIVKLHTNQDILKPRQFAPKTFYHSSHLDTQTFSSKALSYSTISQSVRGQQLLWLGYHRIGRGSSTSHSGEFSNLRPFLSINFLKGFQKSKKFGRWTFGSGGKKTFKRSEKVWRTDRQTNIRTFRLTLKTHQ